MRTAIVAFLSLPLAGVLGYQSFDLVKLELKAFEEKPFAPEKVQEELKTVKEAVVSLPDDLQPAGVFIVQNREPKGDKTFAKLAGAFKGHSDTLDSARKNMDQMRKQEPAYLSPQFQTLWDNLYGSEMELDKFRSALEKGNVDSVALARQQELWRKLLDSKNTAVRAKRALSYLKNIEKIVTLIAAKEFSEADFRTLDQAAGDDYRLFPLARKLAARHIKRFWSADRLPLDTQVGARFDGQIKALPRGKVSVFDQDKDDWVSLDTKPDLQFVVRPVWIDVLGGGRYTNPEEFKNKLCPTSKSIVAHAYNQVFAGRDPAGNSEAPAGRKTVELRLFADQLCRQCADLAYKEPKLKARFDDEKIDFVIATLRQHNETWGAKLESLRNIIKDHPELFK